MKKLLFILLFIPVLCSAQFVVTSSGGIVGASDCAFVQCNDFETEVEDLKWTVDNGSPDFDFPTGSWGFSGAHCVEMSTEDNERAWISVTERVETWITIMVNTNDNNEYIESVVELYNDNTLLATLKYDEGNDWFLVIEGGSTSGQATEDCIGMAIYLKLRFKQGSGSNAEIEFWASDDGFNWGDNLSLNDGTETLQLNKVMIRNDHDNEIMRFDNFIEHNADITDAR